MDCPPIRLHVMRYNGRKTDTFRFWLPLKKIKILNFCNIVVKTMNFFGSVVNVRGGRQSPSLRGEIIILHNPCTFWSIFLYSVHKTFLVQLVESVPVINAGILFGA